MSDWDVLHDPTGPNTHWTRGNIGEAVPGVQTPLSWTYWGPAIERAARGAFRAAGVFGRGEARIPPRGQRTAQIFCGRAAFRVEDMVTFGDRMPGTSGAAIAASIFGEAPPEITYSPTQRRYPAIAIGLPYTFLSTPRRIQAAISGTERWWRAQVDAAPTRDLAGTLSALRESYGRFDDLVALNARNMFCVVQPMFDALNRLTEKVGVGDAGAITSGYGGFAETAVVVDLWRASRGEFDLAAVVRRHGFHGPLEGELSSRVWREDPTPLERLVTDYADREGDQDPRRRDVERAQRRQELERQLLADVPRLARPAARLVLQRAERTIPLRGVVKVAFMQAFDVLRALSRHAGALLADNGAFDDPDDVFYVTRDELLNGLPRDVRETIALRRDKRAEYLQYRLPEVWTGEPTPTVVGDPSSSERPTRLCGLGVSAGVVEGVVRVVDDPNFAEVEPDEILVSSTTDPSWASIMFISAALVVDIGGAMSHAAVVARELGIPCVVATGNGTEVLRSGDRVRVDGKAGTVEILDGTKA